MSRILPEGLRKQFASAYDRFARRWVVGHEYPDYIPPRERIAPGEAQIANAEVPKMAKSMAYDIAYYRRNTTQHEHYAQEDSGVVPKGSVPRHMPQPQWLNRKADLDQIESLYNTNGIIRFGVPPKIDVIKIENSGTRGAFYHESYPDSAKWQAPPIPSCKRDELFAKFK